MNGYAGETAGTAADGYLAPRRPHVWVAAHLDPGERARCRVCGSENREQHLKIPTQRSKEQR